MTAPAMTGWQRFAAWSKRNLPTRESMERNRLLRPVAHRVLAPELWRFTRRSVPRGVALGMVAGILVPVAQTAVAALFALPFRANVPTAALTTFVTNPLTTPPIWVLAYWIGRWLLRLDAHVPGQPVADAAAQTGWIPWLMQAGPATALGLIVIAVVSAVAGYALSALGWRIWIARKWRHRHRGGVQNGL
ncbi:DUF2062 domain-containing protein [Sphingomonas sp. PB2P19]|uniref:DUF2062 domain-containing protein n=1 Tax=Sphingomonas rhamnosi TaxID=3096156 RepID=UPI002FCC13EC